MSGEVKEVGRTPHVPVVDDRARRDRKRHEPAEPPPSRDEEAPEAPGPPDPVHGKIDIRARAFRLPADRLPAQPAP
jgi:hypothetical protein